VSAVKDRREEIEEMLSMRGEVTLTDLSQKFPNVSVMTLRRDLMHMEEQGRLRRTRGGAIAISGFRLNAEDPFSRRAMQNLPQKRQIARKALKFMQEDHAIFIDSGTTMLFLSQAMPDKRLTVITSSPGVALELAGRRSTEVLCLGGHVAHNTLSISGVEAVTLLQQMNVDIAFIGTSGFDAQAGFTAGNREECLVKIEAMSRARRVIITMDSTKCGRVLPFTFAQLADVDVVISDDAMPPEIAQTIRDAGVELYI